ncbi:MAG: hypothetical protein CMM01_21075 [Rhodopirellula sp.]|nr:hypothetical protein [Rhodopirellula sp.]
MKVTVQRMESTKKFCSKSSMTKAEESVKRSGSLTRQILLNQTQETRSGIKPGYPITQIFKTFR